MEGEYVMLVLNPLASEGRQECNKTQDAETGSNTLKRMFPVQTLLKVIWNVFNWCRSRAAITFWLPVALNSDAGTHWVLVADVEDTTTLHVPVTPVLPNSTLPAPVALQSREMMMTRSDSMTHL